MPNGSKGNLANSKMAKLDILTSLPHRMTPNLPKILQEIQASAVSGFTVLTVRDQYHTITVMAVQEEMELMTLALYTRKRWYLLHIFLHHPKTPSPPLPPSNTVYTAIKVYTVPAKTASPRLTKISHSDYSSVSPRCQREEALGAQWLKTPTCHHCNENQKCQVQISSQDSLLARVGNRGFSPVTLVSCLSILPQNHLYLKAHFFFLPNNQTEWRLRDRHCNPEWYFKLEKINPFPFSRSFLFCKS